MDANVLRAGVSQGGGVLEGDGHGRGVRAPITVGPWASRWPSQRLSFLTCSVETTAATPEGDWNNTTT